MNKYLHAVGLCIGLTAVIIMSAFNALFMTPDAGWFESVKIDPTLYFFLWLASYILTAFTFGEFCVRKSLRRFVFLPVVFVILNIIWCFLFFKLNEPVSACVILGLISAVVIAELIITTKSTRYVCFAVLVNMLWYFYLFGVNIIIAVFNA
jgi:tryptophan-rich sensory protein